MKEVKKDTPEYEELPHFLAWTVEYLNRLLAIDPVTITLLLNTAYSWSGVEDPVAICTVDVDEGIKLSAFGILAPLANTKSYRLAKSWDSDDTSGPITRFCILKVDEQ
jgi:hypothetical protein